MRIRNSATTLVLLLFIGAPVNAQACRPADDVSRSLIAYLKAVVVTSDSAERVARDSIYKIPVVSPSSITLVTTARTCSDAAQALRNAEVVKNPNPRSVTVVAVGGKYYAVEDPTWLVGERQMRTVRMFDSRWKPVGGFSGP
jgi:hypothetical protein